jgi:UDP-N-acetylglucosamine 1-carboxyvinyltransferase
MTRLSGVSTFHETVYSTRFSHIAELVRMGAVVSLDDMPKTAAYGFTDVSREGQVLEIQGPTRLHGTTVTGDNLRGSAALLIAGLIADGHTTVRGSEHLVRGYDNLIKRIRDLGADIAE